MKNKYPVGKFIRCCNDSVLYRNEYYFISSLLLFLIINSYRMLYLKNLPPRKLSFPYLYTLPQSCVVAGRYAGMTDIADMPTYAYIAPFPHMQFAQVCIQRGKAARVPDFDVPAVTAAIPGFNDFPAS